MIELFKDNLTLDEMSEIWYGWDNEGLLYGWENGEAGKAYAILEENGYNMDSIKVMNRAFVTLGELVGAI
ncbi:hypothetical protein ODGCJCGO_00008 [Enterococcus phage EFKL]|nr:hypothetical protein ODGCJCGO_00008 [Enterococcus phage EFKL]